MKPTLTLGLSVLAGVALFEAALIPGVMIGAAAVLAPKYLPRLARRIRAPFKAKMLQPDRPQAALPAMTVKVPLSESAKLAAQQALVKTITFRTIVTTLDFSANYVVIGELATAAGLSAFSLAAGPFFYFVHEIAWNKYDGTETMDSPHSRSLNTHLIGVTINRVLAKTITYRIVATTMDFTANYVAVADIATAAGLSAFGFVLGPFIYFGHEVAWDRYGWLSERAVGESEAVAF